VLLTRAFLRFITGFGALDAVADLAGFAVLALVLNGPDTMDDATSFHFGWFTENLMTQALIMLFYVLLVAVLTQYAVALTAARRGAVRSG